MGRFGRSLLPMATHPFRLAALVSITWAFAGIATALRLRARITNDRFNFDRAKGDVIARTSL